MAYLHCHNCHWAQDDFWDKNYNPVKFFFGSMLPLFWKPRMVGTDPDAMGTNKLAWMLGISKVKVEPYVPCEKSCVCEGETEPTTVRAYYEHSWYTLLRQFGRMLHKLTNQEFWTYNDWNDAVKFHGKWPACPRCLNFALDID